jgi:hypothetical protein
MRFPLRARERSVDGFSVAWWLWRQGRRFVGGVVSLCGAGEEVAGGESKDAGHGGEQGAVAVDADQTGAEGDGDGLGVVMRCRWRSRRGLAGRAR